MAGRPRLAIGTFGEITVNNVAPGRFQASTRFRDWDGQTRQVIATGASRNAAQTELKTRLVARMRSGDLGDTLSADSPFADLAAAWLDDLMLDTERSDGTKEVYERELRTLVMPTFQHFTVWSGQVGGYGASIKARRCSRQSRAPTVLGLKRTRRTVPYGSRRWLSPTAWA